MMKWIERILIILLLTGVFLYCFRIFIAVVWGEQYYPIAPAIDTRYAKEYSENKFEMIDVGMTKKDVTAILGNPLSIQTKFFPNRILEDGSVELWYYTRDGVCWWGDFAWMGREIFFDKENKVTRKTKPIHRD